MGRVRHACIMMPAVGMPQGWTPSPDVTAPIPVAPTPARPGPLPEPFRSRHPCRVMPALTPELVAAYARRA